MKYLLNIPSITKLEKKYVNDVLNKGWLSAEGEHTKIFEKKLSKLLTVKHGFAVQSGTAALHTALKTLGVKSGDRVIVPNYTCLSNLSAVTQCGAIPIIVEVERETMGLDYNLLKKSIKIYKPKVVQLVHVYGFFAKDTLKIVKLCKKNNIKLLEDNSEALGSSYKGKMTGKFGDISIASLRSEKMIGVGEGGFISTDNFKLYDQAYLYASRNAKYRTSKDPYWKKYFAQGEGYNYRLPHLLGALGRAQIERFKKDLLAKKITVGKNYRTIFKDERYDFMQKIAKGSRPVYWLNGIYIKNSDIKKTIKVGNALMKEGVEVRSAFWPLNEQEGFKFKYVGNKKVCKDVFAKSIILPSAYNMSIKDIKNIKKILDKILNKLEL